MKKMQGLLKNDQKKSAKLRLNKETLTLLEDHQLWLVAGQGTSVCVGTGLHCCQAF